MNRYSILNGTRENQKEETLGFSPAMNLFLSGECGVTNPLGAISAVNQYISGMEELAGYDTAPRDQFQPVRICYSAMHLNQLKAYEGTKAFSAITITGAENRGRGGKYIFTTVFSKDQMLASDKDSCYLDQIFGGKLVTWIDVKNFLTDTSAIRFEGTPAKVEPELNAKDRPAVLAALDALYQKKPVVILVEPSYSFNDRSLGFLKQVYSMMPPKMASEIGFASYQSPAGIKALVNNTGIRLFTVPAAQGLEGMDVDNVEIINLEDCTVVPESPVCDLAAKWWKLSWKNRQSAMELLFARVSGILDRDAYIDLSGKFFEAKASFDRWTKGMKDEQTVVEYGSKSVAALKSDFESHEEWTLIPWALEEYSKRIRKANPNLKQLVTDVARDWALAEGDEKKKLQQLMKFGANLLGAKSIDTKQVCDVLKKKLDADWTKVVNHTETKTRAEERARADERVHKTKEEGECLLRAEQEEHAKTRKEGERLLRAEQEEHAKTREKSAADMAAAVASYTAKITAKDGEICTLTADRDEARGRASNAEAVAQIAQQERDAAIQGQKEAQKRADTAETRATEAANARAEAAIAVKQRECDSVVAVSKKAAAEATAAAKAAVEKQQAAEQACRDAESARDSAVAAQKKAEKDRSDMEATLKPGLFTRNSVLMFSGIAAAAGAVLVGLVWLLVALLTKAPVIPCQEQGHATEIRGAVQATCIQAGSTGDVYCTACNEVVVPATVLPALEHQWGEASYVEATDEQGAMNVFTCSVCGTTKEEPVEEVEPETEPTLPPESSPVEYIDWSREDAEELLLSAVDASIVSRDGLEFSDELQKLAETCEVVTVISNGEVESEDGPNYAVLMKGHADSPVDPVEGTVVTAQGGSYVLVAYGNDSTTLAGIRALALSTKAPSEDASMEEGVDVTAESTNTEAPAVFFMNVDGRYVDLNAMFESNDWWLDIKSWDTTGEHAPFKIAPSLSVETQRLSAYLINYEDDVDGASSLVENYTTSERAEPNEFGYQNEGLALVGQRN